VQFWPESPEGRQAHAETQADGSFRLSTDGADGAVPGAYRVQVFKFDTSGQARGKRSVLPDVYGTQETPLRCTVPHEGPVVLELSDKDARR
jgi:hypothetical protein